MGGGTIYAQRRRAMAAIQPKEEQTAMGVTLMIVAVALFICIDTSAKWLFIAGLAPIQIAFARYAGHFIYGLVYFIPQNGVSVFRSERPVMQVLRSMGLLGSTVLNFMALSFLPITTTTTIMFAMPIIITVLVIPILGEKVGIRRFLSVCVGFCGVLVVTQPWSAEWHPAMLFSLGAVSSAALYFIMTRLLAGVDSNATLQVWASGIPTVILLPFAVTYWVWPETVLAWIVLMMIGMLGLVSHSIATLAHRYAEAALLSPVVYSQIFFAIIAGIFVFDTWPTIYTFFGGVIIIASGLYIWVRERQASSA
jgi:drug/metabolite transporter (DMT)-like permease